MEDYERALCVCGFHMYCDMWYHSRVIFPARSCLCDCASLFSWLKIFCVGNFCGLSQAQKYCNNEKFPEFWECYCYIGTRLYTYVVSVCMCVCVCMSVCVRACMYCTISLRVQYVARHSFLNQGWRSSCDHHVTIMWSSCDLWHVSKTRYSQQDKECSVLQGLCTRSVQQIQTNMSASLTYPNTAHLSFRPHT